MPTGGACHAHGQCAYLDSVCKGLGSGSTGVCVFGASSGQACDPDSNPNYELACLSRDEYCNPQTRRCEALPGAGALCYGAGLCGHGSQCEFDSWT